MFLWEGEKRGREVRGRMVLDFVMHGEGMRSVVDP